MNPVLRYKFRLKRCKIGNNVDLQRLNLILRKSSLRTEVQSTQNLVPGCIAMSEERFRAEFSTIVDNFAKLIRASKISDIDVGEGQKAPSEIMDVFAEKMLLSAQRVLEMSSDLKRRAFLNDVQGRNSEVFGKEDGSQKSMED